MSALAGIASPGKIEVVNKMLDKISHRGDIQRMVISHENATLGVTNTQYQLNAVEQLKNKRIASDDAGGRHFTRAKPIKEGVELLRDELGVMPMYYGRASDGALCFAAEVKGLLEVTNDINELPPGHRLRGKRIEPYFKPDKQSVLRDSAEQIAGELRNKLDHSVNKRINNADEFGSLLSGGLDSSAITALARPYVNRLHTFAAGTPDAPDLMHAREVARFVGSRHHEIIVELEDLLKVLPDVIYHLESFDALLVRSSLTHYLVARLASDYVPAVFSGEGGDELFAGYSYLKDINSEKLENELKNSISQMHNTALQRVDRCTSAHGIIALVAFLDPAVVSFALRIPISYKIRQNIEKWILRQALKDILPESVVDRPKAKFWEGAGVGTMLSQWAESRISDQEFAAERGLPNGEVLNSKEELLYYRIFCDHFGELDNISWVGRTKGAPVS